MNASRNPRCPTSARWTVLLVSLAAALGAPAQAVPLLTQQVGVGGRIVDFDGANSGSVLIFSNGADLESAGLDGVEHYVEQLDVSGDPTLKVFSSALAELSGNLEVGVDVHAFMAFRGSVTAVAAERLTSSNRTLDPLLLGLEIAPGEVLFRSARPFDGSHEGWFSVTVLLDSAGDVDSATGLPIPDGAFDEAEDTLLFEYRLHLTSRDGGALLAPFFVEPDTTGNVGFTEVRRGVDNLWGIETGAFSTQLLVPALVNGVFRDTVELEYRMEVFAADRFLEDGISVKLGDPLDLTGGGSFSLVPEPDAGFLLGAGLLLLAAQSPSQRFASSISRNTRSSVPAGATSASNMRATP
jgi:hypothetical protein